MALIKSEPGLNKLLGLLVSKKMNQSEWLILD